MHKFKFALAAVAAITLSAQVAEARQATATFGATLRIIGTEVGVAQKSTGLRYTCGAASHVLLQAGFVDPVATSCSGDTYYFNATHNGERVLVLVDSSTGTITTP